jgi:VCBS repeat-containing protein
VSEVPIQGAPIVGDFNWQVEGVGDFNRNGLTDIFWRNTLTGRTDAWFLNGTSFVSSSNLNSPFGSDPNWGVQGVGDFNLDASSDLLWRNRVSGETRIWLLNGPQFVATNSLLTITDGNWRIQGTGDFNADGQTDILWRNFATGRNDIWLMNGTNLSTTVQTFQVPFLNWEALAPFNRFQTPTPLIPNDLAGSNVSGAFAIGSLNGNGTYRDTAGGTDTDYYRFVLSSRTNFRLGLAGPNGSSLTGDLDVEIFDSTNVFSRLSNQNGSTSESIATDLDPGTYYIRVFPKTENDSSAYELNLTVNNLPVLLSNVPLTLEEGTSATIGSSLLQVTDENDPPNRVVYTLLTLPEATSGNISLGGAALIVGSTFTQADINNNRLTYSQNGGETLRDTFTFSVTDGSPEGLIANQVFTINITPANDPPTLATNAILTVTEGAAIAVTSLNLLATDPEQSPTPALLVYSLESVPTNGAFLLNGTTLSAGNTFTQADINSGTRLTYRHNGTETPTADSFTFGLSDSAGGIATPASNTFSIAIAPSNDPPVLLTNVGLTVSEDESKRITAEILNATDAELQTAAQRDQIIYTIVTPPARGAINRNGVTGVTSFTQADIDNGRVFYDHDGSDSNSDSFTFTISDAIDNIGPFTFNIAVTSSNFVPIIATNTGISAAEGATTTLSPSVLQVSDTDNAPPELVYTLISAPTVGTLNRFGTPLTVNQTFTQADIDTASRITYVHNGNETPPRDSFVFSVFDLAGSGLANQTFSITVTPVDDLPQVAVNNILTLNEGETRNLATSLLSATDPDSLASSLVYTIVNQPTNGTLIRSGVTGITTFTQADLNSNLIQYRQDGSESTSDSFAFQVSSGGQSTDNQTFNIDVIPVDDPPRLVLNTGITVAENGIETIDANELSVTDVDGPGPLVYSLSSTPTVGQLRLGTETLGTGSTFTPADIENGRLTYVHGGNETPNTDIFTFTVLDGGGGALPVTPFSITITPVNDPPILSAPTTGLTLNEDTSFSFSASNRISVTDAENDPLTLQLSVANGTLAVGSGSPSANLTLTGRPSAVNNALSNLIYRPTPNASGTDELSIQLTDGTSTVNQTIELTINPVNDGPTLTVPTTTQTVAEDTALTLNGIIATDIDSGDNPVRLTLRTSNGGNLTLGSAGTLEFLEGTTNGSSTVSVAGTIVDIATALQNLSYQGSQDYNGSDSIVITLDDQGNVGGNPIAVTRTIPISVTAVNDRPSFTKGTDVVVLEDAGRQTVTGWATNISRGAANESTQSLTFNVAVDNTALFTATGRPTINPTTGDLTYTLAPNAFGTANVTVTLRDNGTGENTSEAQTFTITVTPVNDAPIFTRGSNITVNEDTPAQTINWATGITAGPGETGQVLTFLLENDNENLFAVAPTLSDTGVLQFTPAPDATGSAVITVRLQDDGGTENGGVDTSAPQSFTISVSAVNDAPVLTLPGTQTRLEDDPSPLEITGTSLSDVDAGSGALQVTLTALGTGATNTAGTISIASSGGVTVTGNNSNSVTLVGTLTDLNNALSRFNYQNRLNINGTDRIVVSVSDRGNTGSGGARSDTRTLTVNIDAVNDAPVLTISGNTTRPAVEDTLTSISGITVSDVDAGSSPIEVSLSATQGLLTLNPAGLASSNGVGTNTVTLSGTVAALNTALGSLRYQGNSNYFGPDTVSITVNDQSATGSGGALTDTKSLSINVTAVNDLPQLTLPTGPLTVAEDTDFTFTDAAAITLTDVDSGSNPIRVSLTVNSGLLTLTPTNLSLINGGNGTRTATYTGTEADVQAALSTLVYRANPDFSGTDTLTIRVNDLGATGATSAIDVIRSVPITITPVNDQPVLATNATLTVSEGQTRGISNSLLRVTDADNTNTQLVYTLVTPPNQASGTLRLNSSVLSANGTFTQDDINSGRLTYAQNGGEVTNDSFVFRVTDGNEPLPEATFNIVINPINDTPTVVNLQTLAISEGQTATVTNTILRVTDADNTAEQLRYTLTSAPTSGNLRLNGTNLTLNQTFTQSDIDSGRISYRHSGSETASDSLIFTATDGAGGSTGTRVLNIAVTPVNDAPQVVSSGPLTLSEGATTTITNTILRTSDSDTAASSLRYTLSTPPIVGSLRLNGTALNANESFTQQDIDNGRLTYQHNGSESSNDIFVFQVTDGTAAPISRIFNITVNPVNDVPVLVTNTGIILQGEVAASQPITGDQLLVTDIDNTASQVTYTLVSLPGVGSLRLNGTELAANSTFTQADIDAGNLTYDYVGSGGVDTSFQFQVSDGGAGGTLPVNFFDISFNYS